MSKTCNFIEAMTWHPQEWWVWVLRLAFSRFSYLSLRARDPGLSAYVLFCWKMTDPLIGIAARLEPQAPSHFGRWGHPLGYTSYVLSSALITTARHSLLLGEVPVENTSFFFSPTTADGFAKNIRSLGRTCPV